MTLMPSHTAKSLSLLAVLVVVPYLAGAGIASAEEAFKFEYLKPDKCKLQPIDPETGKGGGVICTPAALQACSAQKGVLVANNGQPSCRTPAVVSAGTTTKK